MSLRTYWAGWAFAKYQWYTGLSFECIESVISVSSVIDLYHPYHEMDVKRFFGKLDDLYLAKYPDTNLRRIRRAAQELDAAGRRVSVQRE